LTECPGTDVFYVNASTEYICATDCSTATPAATFKFVNSAGKEQCAPECPPNSSHFNDATTATYKLHT
jgi:hypothetical protein